MLVLHPDRVDLLGVALSGVVSVAIDRATTRLAEEWSDLGPFAVFADAAEQRVTVVIRRVVPAPEGLLTPAPIRPGALGALSVRTGPSAADGRGSVLSATVVVTAVEHSAGAARAAEQTIRAVALSADGAADPVTEIAAP